MDIIGMVKSLSDRFGEVFRWKTGGRTKDQNTLRERGEEAHEELGEALDAGDADAANDAFDAQRGVRDEARAKHRGQ